jgi:hypothetical protein
MNRIPEKTENEKGILESIGRFYKMFSLGGILKAGHAYKLRGVPASSIFKYLLQLVFTCKSMFMSFRLDTDVPKFAKDAVYRFLNSPNINWLKILLMSAEKIICGLIDPLTGAERIDVIALDDTPFERLRAKKVELLANMYDHAAKKYKRGFRLLTAVWTDGVTTIPLMFRHMSSENRKNRYREINPSIDRRSCGYKARKQAVSTMPKVLLEMLACIAKTGIKAKHVLFDSWFASPSAIINILALGFHVVARLKANKTHYLVGGEKKTLRQIYNDNKKRRGRSKYLLSVAAQLQADDGRLHDIKIVFVRDRANCKKWIALLSTDMELTEEQIIELYGKRWSIEVFFKVCKSYLMLAGEFQQLSYDAITAHTAIVFLRYSMLAVEKRRQEDDRTVGDLFYLICGEIPDMKFAEVIEMIIAMLRETLDELLFLTNDQIGLIIDSFMSKLPQVFKACLFSEPSIVAEI